MNPRPPLGVFIETCSANVGSSKGRAQASRVESNILLLIFVSPWHMRVGNLSCMINPKGSSIDRHGLHDPLTVMHTRGHGIPWADAPGWGRRCRDLSRSPSCVCFGGPKDVSREVMWRDSGVVERCETVDFGLIGAVCCSGAGSVGDVPTGVSFPGPRPFSGPKPNENR